MKGTKMGHGGQHHVKQDKDYVSKVDPSIVNNFLTKFGKPPVANRAAYQAATSIHPDGFARGQGPIKTTIAQDMPLAPTVYGFADKNAVDQWFELAFDTPT